MATVIKTVNDCFVPLLKSHSPMFPSHTPLIIPFSQDSLDLCTAHINAIMTHYIHGVQNHLSVKVQSDKQNHCKLYVKGFDMRNDLV